MSKEMMDLANWTLEAVKQAGAQNAEVGLSKSRFVNIRYRLGEPENISEASSMELGLSVYVDGRYSAQNTSDLRKSSLTTFVENAVATTRLLAEDPNRTLPDPKYYADRPKLDLGVSDPNYDMLTPEMRHKMAKQVENACLKVGGDKVISVTGEQYDGFNSSIRLNTNGFQGARTSTSFWIGADMTAKDEGDRRPNGWQWVGTRKLSQLPDPDTVGSQAAKRTLDLLGAKKIPTETLPIIVENQQVGRLLSGFVSALSGDNIQQKRSFLADKKGQQVGSNLFTLVDDPHLIGGMGSRLYDGDGITSKKMTIVESGVIKDFYVDWYYSRKLGCEPTTGNPSNMVLPAGVRSIEEIMMDLGRGILITGFLGGNSNSTTGDFSVGIQGMLFDGGKPVQAVAEMNIADNHLTFWNKLIEAANDPWIYSDYRFPSIVIDKVVVSGV